MVPPAVRPGTTNALNSTRGDCGHMPNIAGLEQALGYRFRDQDLPAAVLTHSSILNEPPGKGRRSNAQLAFLGDAVIELAVRSELYRKLPLADEGRLSILKAELVSDLSLANVA